MKNLLNKILMDGFSLYAQRIAECYSKHHIDIWGPIKSIKIETIKAEKDCLVSVILHVSAQEGPGLNYDIILSLHKSGVVHIIGDDDLILKGIKQCIDRL